MLKKHQFNYKREQLYWVEKIYTDLGFIFFMPWLKKTFVSANMVTLVNLVVTIPLMVYYIINKEYLFCVVIMQLYVFLDILDGNLAREKKQSSNLGKYLDKTTDILYYTICFPLLAYSVDINTTNILLFIIMFHVYGIVTSFYIVPKLKKMKDYKRWGLKKFLNKKGYILGMDNGTQEVIISIFILSNYKKIGFLISAVLYLVDLLYRIVELKRNERLIILKEEKL